MRSFRYTAAVLALSLWAGTAQARTIEGVDFPEELNIAGHTVKLVGVGLRTRWWFNVYVMGAYQANPVKSARHLIKSDEPKFLWIKMLRSISGEKMRDALDEGMEKNVPEEARAKLKDRMDQFKAQFPEEIKKGLEIGFTYLPGKGTLGRIEKQEKGPFEGKDFQEALWSVWFGKKPADKDLKKGILSKE
jgi:hypothetical protein